MGLRQVDDPLMFQVLRNYVTLRSNGRQEQVAESNRGRREVFALSRNRDKLFIYEPKQGMGIPMLIDFKLKQISVEVLNAYELESDYSVYRGLSEINKAVDKEYIEQVDFVKRVSLRFSYILQDKLENRKLKISELRKLFVKAWREASKQKESASHDEVLDSGNAAPGAMKSEVVVRNAELSSYRIQ
ncbi:hypothetical protein ACLBYG_31025 [Methylobacterium sp. D53M]